MKIMKARVKRMIVKGFSEFSRSFALLVFCFSLPEKKMRMPITVSKRERTSGKIPGPGWVNLPTGS